MAVIARQQYGQSQQQHSIYVHTITRVMRESELIEQRTETAHAIELTGCNNQQPVGATVPSQTIHIPKELYQYILDTEGDNTTSGRAVELMEKGMEVEQNG